MVSDATEDIVLLDAGLKKAKGIIICLPEDAYTLLTTLTARGINPVIQIVARAERLESEEKLLRAGANIVINPSSIGGKRMAMSILKPTSVEYVDTLLHSKNEEYSVEEIRIINGSSLIGKTIAEADILGNYDTLIMGIARNGSIIANPPAHEMLKEMDCLIAFGSGPRLSLLEKEAKG